MNGNYPVGAECDPNAPYNAYEDYEQERLLLEDDDEDFEYSHV